MAKVGPHMGIKKIPKNYLASSQCLGDHKKVSENYSKRATGPH
jgi:hypothetical protein